MPLKETSCAYITFKKITEDSQHLNEILKVCNQFLIPESDGFGIYINDLVDYLNNNSLVNFDISQKKIIKPSLSEKKEDILTKYSEIVENVTNYFNEPTTKAILFYIDMYSEKNIFEGHVFGFTKENFFKRNDDQYINENLLALSVRGGFMIPILNHVNQ